MAKKAKTADDKPKSIDSVEITFDLFDLPTAQHKAGLAGLVARRFVRMPHLAHFTLLLWGRLNRAVQRFVEKPKVGWGWRCGVRSGQVWGQGSGLG